MPGVWTPGPGPTGGDDVFVGDGTDEVADGGAGTDTLSGNGGNDTLIGGAGADALDGGDGVDTADYSALHYVWVNLSSGLGYVGHAEGDTLVNIENLTGSGYNDILVGDGLANALVGGLGADKLSGLGGADVLSGGGGADMFVFQAALGAGNVDVISDFSVADDIMHLDAAVFAGLAVGALPAGAFVIGAQTVDGDDRIVYNSATGALSFDADGNGGAAVQFATLATGLALTATDFLAIPAAWNPGPGPTGGDDVFVGGETSELADGGAGNDTLSGNEGRDILIGGAGNDTLFGNSRRDILIGGADADALNGGSDTDTADYSSSPSRVRVNLLTGVALDADAAGDTFVSIENLTGSAFDDELTGTDDANILVGGAGDDQLSGLGGADVLLGGAGADALSGGDGMDLADYSASAARVRVNLTTGAGLDGDAQGDTLTGIEQVTGSAFNDILTGDGGNVVMNGGAGDDTFVVAEGVGALYGGGGTDTIDYSARSNPLQFNLLPTNPEPFPDYPYYDIENVIGTAFNDVITGNEVFNELTGGAGDDTLDGSVGGGDRLIGGEGADTLKRGNHLEGGEGDDTLIFNASVAAGGVIDGGAGTDTVTVQRFGGDFLAATILSIEKLHLSTSASATLGAAQLGAGFAANLVVQKTVAANVQIDVRGSASGETIDLSGWTFVGWTGSNRISIAGEGGVDTLIGSSQTDILTGGAGADALNGGGGIDTANYAGSATRVRVNLATGTGLDADAQGDTLTGVENLEGSSFNDILIGDNNANVINGLAGADSIIGAGGADRLDGGADIDTVNYSNSGSRVRVSLASGTGWDGTAEGDKLFNVENLIGSRFNDILIGNAVANALSGGLGDDQLIGGLGADALNGGDGVDTADYSAAASRVRIDLTLNVGLDADAQGDTFAGVENLIGSAFNDSLAGDSAANALTGGAGNDRLTGFGGADMLVSGAGKDMFVFAAALGAGNVDVITDFSVTNDTMSLDNAFFTGLLDGALSAGEFQTGASASEADDRIIYDPATGALLFDADGNGAGAAVQFASLSAGLALTNADFLVI